ncbi:hypothetical protein AVEN_185041-1 [Araneus ventricosus]|uniref:Uncharacterized protein n=1 Tax=Araneus ventricosus TaxID=182803 RepID=A0A4Y2BPC9_ARAVE|nr:hypothetical protein AVEN_185041-1 [Araneus ventricosus]
MYLEDRKMRRIFTFLEEYFDDHVIASETQGGRYGYGSAALLLDRNPYDFFFIWGSLKDVMYQRRTLPRLRTCCRSSMINVKPSQ